MGRCRNCEECEDCEQCPERDKRRDFASPVYFNKTADKDGKVTFHEVSTTDSDEVVTVGAIYIKSTSFNQIDEQESSKVTVSIKVSEAPLVKGDRSVAKFQEFVDEHRMNPCMPLALSRSNWIKADGPFPDQTCVPGYNSGCCTRQHGFLTGRSGQIEAAHFVVDFDMSGFCPGQTVSGFMLLEILPTAGSNTSP